MITSKAAGASGLGTTSVAAPYPAVTAGDTLLLVVYNKYPSNGPVTPSGWTLVLQQSGGAGSAGLNDGPVYVTVYSKTSDGTETGSVTVSIPSANTSIARIYRYSSFGPVTIAAAGAANNSASTSWSATFSDPGIVTGDFCVVFNGVNVPSITWTVNTLTTPGVAYGTPVVGSSNSATGDGIGARVTEHSQSVGASTGASTFAMTGSAGTPSGAAVLVRMREAAIQYGGIGATATGTTSLSVAYPTPINAGDALVLSVVNKYPTNGPSTPAGWTLQGQASGGVGTTGVDTGQMYTTVFTKIADGTETGSLAVTITGSNTSQGAISRYVKPGSALAFSASTGSRNAASTAWSATMAADPNITAGGFVVAVSGVNTDGRTFTAESVAATGTTFDTAVEILDTGSVTGDDIKIVLSHHMCMTGVASAPAVYTMTASGSDNSTEPAGSTVLLNINAAIVGTLSSTLGAIALSSTGLSPVVGTLSGTLGAVTLSSTGLSPVVGTLSKTLGAVTLSSAGFAPVVGTLSGTLGAITISGAAAAPAVGTLSGTLGAIAIASTAAAPAKGTLTGTLGALTLASTGLAPAVGTLAATLGAVTLASLAGAPVDVATLSTTLGEITLSATGFAPVVGTLAKTLGAITLTGVGSSPIVGTLSATLGAISLSTMPVMRPGIHMVLAAVPNANVSVAAASSARFTLSAA